MEFLNGYNRWCLWLKDADPSRLKSCTNVLERIDEVKSFRLKSKKKPTREAAHTPALFAEIRQPSSDYLAVPEVSSENRTYMPIGYLSANVIASNLIYTVSDATLYEFSIITSLMHMAWMRYITGRLKSDYRYSSSLVYNNFPWPEVSEKEKEDIAEKGQAVLGAREQFPDSTLADLYDPNTMPPVLFKAHQALDKAVDKAYRKAAFKDEKERIEFLFQQYQKLISALIGLENKRVRKKA